jgi:hypothetical protein
LRHVRSIADFITRGNFQRLAHRATQIDTATHAVGAE